MPFMSMNMHTYVGNNPIRFFDPLGLCKGDDAKDIEMIRQGFKYHDEHINDLILHYMFTYGSP
jgi:hypothetical protein